MSYSYTYDVNGNITSIVDDDKRTEYKYDDQGQLIREDNPYFNKTYVYTYDNAGNRTSKKTYAYTTGTLGTVTSTETYTYGDDSWGDKLTGVNGSNITYDEIGNPLCYGNYIYYEWQNGRQLKSVSQISPYYKTTYTYNDGGIRTSKDVSGIKHTYTLNGSQIVGEEWTNGSTTFNLIYLYDESGSPIGMQYRTSRMAWGEFNNYFFEKNLQGDIIAVYNESGTKIGTYTYDAWGNIKVSVSSGITALEKNIVQSYNPFRYRGYYYDTESGFYYLQSRYYNPQWGRFLNADGQFNETLLGSNLFAYCENNPIMGYDPIGEKTFSFGFSFSFGLFGAGYTFSIGISVDDDGMVAFQCSYSLPNGYETRDTELGVNVGAGIYIQQTDVEGVDDLKGISKAAGICADAISYDRILNEYNKPVGNQVGVGVGVTYSAHANKTQTVNIGKPFRSFGKWFNEEILKNEN